MSTLKTRKLLRKLVTLSILVMCLCVLTSGNHVVKTRAVTCCSTCTTNYERCLTRTCGCIKISPGQYNCTHASSGCVSQCQLQFDQCDLSCDQNC
jgi:hypothetical protein